MKKKANEFYNLLVFPERHLDKIRWTEDIFDDLTASNNSFSRFILLIDLSINKLRFIIHAHSSWILFLISEKKKEEEKKMRDCWAKQSTKCQSKKKREKEQIRWISYETNE